MTFGELPSHHLRSERARELDHVSIAKAGGPTTLSRYRCHGKTLGSFAAPFTAQAPTCRREFRRGPPQGGKAGTLESTYSDTYTAACDSRGSYRFEVPRYLASCRPGFLSLFPLHNVADRPIHLFNFDSNYSMFKIFCRATKSCGVSRYQGCGVPRLVKAWTHRCLGQPYSELFFEQRCGWLLTAYRCSSFQGS